MALNPITYTTIAITSLLAGSTKLLLKSGQKYQKLEDRLMSLEADRKENDEMNKQILNRLDLQDETLSELKTQIAVLTTTVIGIDGTNGIRGDLRELRDDIKSYFKKSAMKKPGLTRRVFCIVKRSSNIELVSSLR